MFTNWPKGLRSNVATAVRDPRLLVRYAIWAAARARSNITGDPITLSVSGARLSGFQRFSNYLGAWVNRPTREELSFIASSLTPEGTAFDVGANFGVMSVHMSRSAPAGAVHAFEPNPTTFKAMRANMKINRCYNVRCVQAAVSSTVGQGGFTDTSDPGTNKIDGSSEMTVPLTTIDHYLEENSIPAIDFIKIDVEGAEIAVLEGARVALKRGVIKRGMIEVCPGTLAQFGNTAPEIFDLLSGAGYELFWLDAPQHPLSSADLRKLSNQFLGNAGFALRGAR